MTYSNNAGEIPASNPSTVSWIHIGDPHITRAGEQNEADLGRIVDEVNQVYARGGIDFVFIPGDIADDGSAAAYQVFRRHVDRLEVPWHAIVGDHDVHEKSFHNYCSYVSPTLFQSFAVGSYRFFLLNAFSLPRPDAFTVEPGQLSWLEAELKQSSAKGHGSVIFLHCYPSDLKAGGRELMRLLRQYPVLLVDMGHTHYNEISNDGTVLYTATRSTGQIEEGPPGYSIATLDGNVVSWHFVPLGSPGLVAITNPGDMRLRTIRTESTQQAAPVQVRAKVWLPEPVATVHGTIAGRPFPMKHNDGVLWSGMVDILEPGQGAHDLEVTAIGAGGQSTSSRIRIQTGPMPTRPFSDIDQENTIGAWEDRGILGTQLGPNKNGRKW